MVHGDPHQRSARLAEITEILKQQAPSEDGDLLLSLAPILFAGMPARLALDLPAPAVAARILSHFRFVAREMPPGHQLYKGLPGIHVSVRNPTEEEARVLGGGAGLPLESTIVETHTPDRPFIFDSVKNYLQKSGLRVYSAIHPIFTVRRQWERIVALGDAQDEGSRESYCFFQIEPLATRERVRRVEHEVFSLLKAVFLAVDDFKDMGRACRELVPRLRSRRGDAAELASVRAFLEWLLDDNYIFMGTVSYSVAPDGTASRVEETANGAFTDPTLLPVVFPGVVEHVEAHLHPAPGDERILDLDFCASASAIYHLEPIEDLTVREWGEDGRLTGLTLLLGRFARGAFAQRADRIPILKEKEDRLLEACGAIPSSHVWREIARDLQPLPEDRPLLRRRQGPRADHPADRARGERRRDRDRGPQGRGVRGSLRGLLAAALRLPDRGGPAPRLRRRLRPRGLRDVGRLRPGDAPHLLLRLPPSRAPRGPRGGAPAHGASRDRLGGPRGRGPRAGVRGARGPEAPPPIRDAGVAQRPLPRGDDARAGARRPAQARGAREPARGERRSEDVGDGLRAARLGGRARPHRHPEDDAEPGAHRSPRSCASR